MVTMCVYFSMKRNVEKSFSKYPCLSTATGGGFNLIIRTSALPSTLNWITWLRARINQTVLVFNYPFMACVQCASCFCWRCSCWHICECQFAIVTGYLLCPLKCNLTCNFNCNYERERSFSLFPEWKIPERRNNTFLPPTGSIVDDVLLLRRNNRLPFECKFNLIIVF